MKIIIPVIVVFAISFLLLSMWIYKGEKKELEDKNANILHVIGTAFILALAPTAVIGISLFVLLGSTNAVNIIFSFNLSTNQLIILTISFFVYLFTIDKVIYLLIEHILGENEFHYSILLLIRIGVFYMIGEIIGLNQTVSISIATGVALITFLIEVLGFIPFEKEK